MKKSTSDLIALAGTGANIIIDASAKSISDIISIVGIIGRKGSHITLRNCDAISISDLLSICKVYPNNITIEI